MPNVSTIPGYHIPPVWFQWEQAYFGQLSTVINNDSVPARLVKNGCYLFDGSINCNKACGNVTLMFETPETLWNCVTLATLSLLTRFPHEDPGRDRINATHEAEANRTLNFGELRKLDYPFRLLRGCALESCSTFGGCPFPLTEVLAIPINTSRIDDFANIMSGSYCASAHPGIDFDIAGPGVVIAYFFQFGLAFFFAVSFTITTDWMKTDKPKFLKKTGFARAVLCSIADLQETQASFLITVAGAAVATFLGKKGTGLANISTVISWITNDTILKGVVAAGSYPLLLIQLVLHASETRWWYMLLFVVVNVIMVLLIHRPKDMDPESLLPHFQKAAVDLTGCGRHPGPRTFCQKYQEISLNPIKEPGRFFKFKSKYPFPIYLISAILALDWIIHTAYCRFKDRSVGKDRSVAKSFSQGFQRGLGMVHEAISTILGRYRFLGTISDSWKAVEVHLYGLYRGVWALLELFTFGMCILAVSETIIFLEVLKESSEGDLNITRWAFVEFGTDNFEMYEEITLRRQKGSAGRVIRNLVTMSVSLARLDRFKSSPNETGNEEEMLPLNGQPQDDTQQHSS
ncbi:hypothetical protein CGCVW01_v011635 [Colletotrichum viniferum]|nr:hypothetical protein CGCVW01_v011635 [Colletotrichum viniferum]